MSLSDSSVMASTVKQELYELCQEYIRKRIDSARAAIDSAQQSANEETKSSSGDKYETGRAMAQLEIEKNAHQLSESLKLKASLDTIRIDINSSTAQAGNLVMTDQGSFFIAISLGKIIHREQVYFVIAPTSPLGLQFLGAKVGDKVNFRNGTYVVRELV